MLMRDLGTPVLPPVSKTETGAVRVALRHPSAHGSAAQPLVLEGLELGQVGVGVNVTCGDPN